MSYVAQQKELGKDARLAKARLASRHEPDVYQFVAYQSNTK
jgi:hypothetical protein